MSPTSSTTWDTKPQKPIFYGPLARLADRFVGRGDGNAAIPEITAAQLDVAEPRPVTTPYLEIRRRHFLDRSEREHRHALNDLAPVQRQLAAVQQEIAGGEEKLASIRKRLQAIPEQPTDMALNTRNVVEQNIDKALVHARRRREHHAARAAVVAEEQQAAERLRVLRVEEARLIKAIATRKEILGTRVRQLHEHTLRRCGTYRHHLVRRHPEGAALIPYLNLALPDLPDWLSASDPGTGPAATEPGPEPGPAASRLADLRSDLGHGPSLNGRTSDGAFATPAE
jgi:hypothetical protein